MKQEAFRARFYPNPMTLIIHTFVLPQNLEKINFSQNIKLEIITSSAETSLNIINVFKEVEKVLEWATVLRFGSSPKLHFR